jgi:Asp/Glu/hydantoin racemase
MKLLFINPNITEAITDVMATEARKSASPGTEIVPVTAKFGTLYIENRAEAAIAAHAVLEALAEHRAGCDAAIISAFGDPGLSAGRELMDMPVVGIAEAAFLIAYTQGRRYSIVCPTKRLRTWFMECAVEHGLDGRMVSARALTGPVADITRAKQDLADPIVEQCRLAVEEDDAEVVILGGGPVAGLAREIAPLVPVPVIDGVSCAVQLAESLVALNLRAPERGSFARPASKPAQNLSPALSALIDRD